MVKAVNVTLDDEDYYKIVKAKGELTWREFFLKLLILPGLERGENGVIPNN